MKEEGRNKWFHDPINPYFLQLHSLKGIVYSAQTQYQAVDIIETDSFGRCLVLDGKIQSSERDEFIYHEALVHPALVSHPLPQAVFIAGGGEGATLREVLSHKSVQRAVMVDIDGGVVDACRRFLPGHHQGSFDDSRVELRLEDARAYLSQAQERYDVIIIDIPDPMEAGPAYLLFTQEFYKIVRQRLGPDGLVVAQAGSTTYGSEGYLAPILHTMKTVFPQAYPYLTEVPAFGGTWGFALASLGPDPLALSPQEIDARLSQRLAHPLRFYDGLTHRGLFHIPKYHRQGIQQERRVITDSSPIYIC